MTKISNPLVPIISKVLNERLKAKVRKYFWPYLCYVYLIEGPNDYKIIEPKIKCNFVPITFDNYQRVQDFRETGRIEEYKGKLMNNEVGIFVEHDGKMIASYWASINKTEVPRTVRTFYKLMPGEGLIHDSFVNTNFRGCRVNPAMVSYMITLLLNEYGMTRIKSDINVKNTESLHSAATLGWRLSKKMLLIAVFGKLRLSLTIKDYT